MPSEEIVRYAGNLPVYILNRQWKTQAKPYIKPLPYTRWEAEMKVLSSNNSQSVINTDARKDSQRYAASANNKAVTRLTDKVNSAMLGNAIGQISQTYGMIAGRSAQLLGAARQLKKGNIRGFLKTLNIHKDARNVNGTLKGASSLWLEYHYGWSPLLGDIHGAVNELNRLLPESRVIRASARESQVLPGIDKTTNRYSQKLTRKVEYSTRVTAVATGETHVGALQLLDPLNVAWELVPFSFVVDWFWPVQTWITMQSPYWRQTISRGSTAHMGIASSSYNYRSKDNQGNWKDGSTNHTAESTYFQRVPGVALNSVVDTSFLRGTSPLRAGHAISMLVQQLRLF